MALLQIKFLTGLHDLAHKNNPRLLAQVLRSSFPLGKGEREKLAEVLENLWNRGRGRPRSMEPPKNLLQMAGAAAYVSQLKAEMRQSGKKYRYELALSQAAKTYNMSADKLDNFMRRSKHRRT